MWDGIGILENNGFFSFFVFLNFEFNFFFLVSYNANFNINLYWATLANDKNLKNVHPIPVTACRQSRRHSTGCVLGAGYLPTWFEN